MPNSKPSASGRFRSFWLKLLDLPDDDQVQRLINSQLITTPSTAVSASQTHLRYQYQIADSGQATASSAAINNQLLNPPSQFGSGSSTTNRNQYKTADKQFETGKAGTSEVQFANSNQNSVYCVSSVNLSRLAFEEQQSGGRASSSAVPLVGSVKFPPEVPTPTQLTIATELPTATKFTTRPASFVDKQAHPRPMQPMDNKRKFFCLFFLLLLILLIMYSIHCIYHYIV